MNEIARDSKVRYIAEPVPADVAEPVIAAGKASVTVAVQTHSFRGPMPPPEHLAQYDRIVPGAGRLIVEEFQMNSQHARESKPSVCAGRSARTFARSSLRDSSC